MNNQAKEEFLTHFLTVNKPNVVYACVECGEILPKNLIYCQACKPAGFKRVIL